mmetsp:Transcript_2421/g.5365  ORF Transcript_2421/g.5365 Transcript_2421/m.5365 type:complete len:233 (-) Transcript_2421:247-945(-)
MQTFSKNFCEWLRTWRGVRVPTTFAMALWSFPPKRCNASRKRWCSSSVQYLGCGTLGVSSRSWCGGRGVVALAAGATASSRGARGSSSSELRRDETGISPQLLLGEGGRSEVGEQGKLLLKDPAAVSMEDREEWDAPKRPWSTCENGVGRPVGGEMMVLPPTSLEARVAEWSPCSRIPARMSGRRALGSMGRDPLIAWALISAMRSSALLAGDADTPPRHPCGGRATQPTGW